MNIFKTKNKNLRNSGMTLFIAVTIMGVLLFVSFAVVNITIKSTLFAASGRDSQIAFYAADAGLECALYHDSVPSISKFDPNVSGSPINCGGVTISSGTPPNGSGTTTDFLIGGGGSVSTPLSINYVQGRAAVSGAGAPSYTVALPQNITAGNTIVGLMVWSYAGCPPTATDTQGNVFTRTGISTSGSEMFYVFTAPVSVSGPDTITITAGCGNSRATFFAEYSGMASNPLDKMSTQLNSANPVSSGNVTTTANGELIAGMFVVSAGGYTYTSPPGTDQRLVSSGNDIFQDQIQATAGVIDSHATANFGNLAGYPAWGYIATFKPGVVVSGNSNVTSTFGFTLYQGSDPTSACAIVTVTKNPDGSTYIKSRGYNTCDINNPRRIERGVEVDY